jgi:lycopene beta-cyclase
MNTHYDYIFTGAGCAGLSLLMRLMKSGTLEGKKVLIVDKSSKTTNDRTWCFWEKKAGFFESLVHHSWTKLSIHGPGYTGTHDITPYRYKMIRGIDFYDHCLTQMKSNPQITMLHEEVLSTGNLDGSAFVTTANSTYTSEYVFNSILFNGPTHHSPLTTHNSSLTHYSLLQHFKGFVIRAPNAVFDPGTGTLMDFRISQQHGTSFVYVLPLSEREALVEYTLFTGHLLSPQAYDQAVDGYIKDVLKIPAYEVVSHEFGVIPMTNIPFPLNDGRIINIGTAGGQTKPSTGYTFAFIQKQVDAIASRLAAGDSPVVKRGFAAKKFLWYDSILLNVLATGKLPGAFIFTRLFRKNRIADVFRFLDNESNLIQDLKVISSLPARVFAKAAIEQATKPPGSPVLHT